MSITNPTEGRQLLAKAIRDSQRVDTIGDTVSFTVKVLSKPVPRSSADMGAILGASNEDAFFTSSIEDRLQFQGRIEGEYFMSPHLCIPDPCNTYGATNSAIAAYQSLHTTCITPKGFENNLKIGDRVRVTCRKGDFKMDLQFANVDSVETNMMSVQTETEIQECQILSTRFADGSGFLENLGSSVTNAGRTDLGLPVTAGSVEYGLGPIMTRIKNGDQSLWPAKVLNLPNKPEINQMYSPCVLGQAIASRPQTARTITYEEEGVTKTKTSAHFGVDICIPSGTPLYACFPGKVTKRLADGVQIRPNGYQPTTSKYAEINIISELEFADGTKATIKIDYGHCRAYTKLPGDGEYAIMANPDAPVLIAYSGGGRGEVGAGGTTGAHLHWEVWEDKQPQGSHFIYRGAIKDPVTLQYDNVTPSYTELIFLTASTETDSTIPAEPQLSLIPSSDSQIIPNYATTTYDFLNGTESSDIEVCLSGNVETTAVPDWLKANTAPQPAVPTVSVPWSVTPISVTDRTTEYESG